MAEATKSVAIVTGGAGGIGSEIAKRLARKQAIVQLVDRDLAGAQAVQAEIEAAGGLAACHEVDVRNHAEVEAVVRKVADSHGRIDVLINNAGGSRIASFMETSLDLWGEMIEVNLTACFLFAREAARHMVSGGGGAHRQHGFAFGLARQHRPCRLCRRKGRIGFAH